MNELMRRMLFLPEQASTFALDVDHLHYFVITVTMVASAGVAVVAIAFFWKYRRRHENQATPFIAPTAMFEVLAISVPLAFFLLWFVIGFRDFVKVSSPPPDAMDVYVQGKQWMWKFAYPDGPNAIGVLHVPANRPVRLLVTSRDVIHSIFVPAFRIKIDALPGRYTEIWFDRHQAGRVPDPLHRVLRRPAQQDVGRGRGDGARGVRRVDQGAAARPGVPAGRAGRRDRPGVPAGEPRPVGQAGRRRAGLPASCHNVDTPLPTGPSWVDLYHRSGRSSTDGEQIIADEAYLTESMMEPDGEGGRGVPAADAQLPGQAHRAGGRGNRGVHQEPPVRPDRPGHRG